MEKTPGYTPQTVYADKSDTDIFTKQTYHKFGSRKIHQDQWLYISKQTVSFLWSILWTFLSFAFKGRDDQLQLWSSFISLIFSVYALFALFFLQRNKKTGLVNYIAWFSLFLVTVLELIFLTSLLIQANYYILIRTNYSTLRVEYLHSKTQIVVLFATGLIGILSLLISAVATQRFSIAYYELENLHKLIFNFDHQQLTLLR
ncbi:UNKNOWN [Stylonychia lemnae]|uniref:Uncharacterized protein n=1 Tax=Stylonychia lemnae TaxID=5949 RepID=A0A077ZV96_STYLE|nr:UNKNOWN [Stylonychia lemnae]|eukprot:CDW72336.1 UNKNOWN [Stylonychia lemnae]